MANDRTDLVRFSAYSMKDLITRKLTENSKFTDQIYEGSNLAVLIDIVSYMYQCLVFQLNNAASESMFADTQIYENIVRLCRFIGYNPRGITPSMLAVTVQGDSSIADKKILPMSMINTGIIDSNGRPICFSTVLWNSSNDAYGYKISDSNTTQSNLSEDTTVDSGLTLVNGQWKRYSSVFTASGTEYETFVLDGLRSDSDAGQYVAGNYVEVFVLNADGSSGEWWKHDLDDIFIKPYSSATDLEKFNNGAFNNIYSGDDAVYSLYLDADKTFCIKFGNGITGRKLRPGQKIYVFYLDTNADAGNLTVDSANFASLSFKHGPALFSLGRDLYGKIFYPNSSDLASDIDDTSDFYEQLKITPNFNKTSSSKKEETVEDIRQNAPDWFKTGNRLITKKDYEYFIKNNSSQIILESLADVKCMNNWDYLATFYKWLYHLGCNPPEYLDLEPNGNRYLSGSRIIQGGYEYVDPADANNLYIWVQPSRADSDETVRQSALNNLKSRLNQSLINIKTLTTELYPLLCIQSVFDISFAPEAYFYKTLSDSNQHSDYSYLEITMDESTVYVNSSVKQQVVQLIHDRFQPGSCRIGQRMDYNGLLDSIYGINGVVKVRTVFDPPEDSGLQSRQCDGAAFAVWSDAQQSGGNIIDIGVDLKISNTSPSLEQFQFPVLRNYGNTDYWFSKIKVIKKSLTSVNPIKF